MNKSEDSAINQCHCRLQAFIESRSGHSKRNSDSHLNPFIQQNNELFVFLISCCAGQRRL